MNKDNARDYLPLVQALAEGKVIQYQFDQDGVWHSTGHPDFSMDPEMYRIKPEPREIWYNRGVNGHERGDYTSREVAEAYAHLGDTQVCYREVIE